MDQQKFGSLSCEHVVFRSKVGTQRTHIEHTGDTHIYLHGTKAEFLYQKYWIIWKKTISRKEYKNFMTDWIHDMEVKIFLYVGQLMSSNTAEGMEWQHDGVLGRHITD